MNIFQKLNEVRMVVEYLQKDKDVAGKYMVVSHDAVTALVRPRLVEHGIITVPNLIRSQTINTSMTTGKGIPIIRYEATYRVTFVNMDEPTERVDVEIESHALDEGDKAPGKALSYAVKYALLKMFNIETGEDEESRADLKVKKDKTITPTSGAWDELEPDVQTWLHDLSNEVRSLLVSGDVKGACAHLDEAGLDNEKRIAIWTRFSSSERSSIKKQMELNRSLKGKQ